MCQMKGYFEIRKYNFNLLPYIISLRLLNKVSQNLSIQGFHITVEHLQNQAKTGKWEIFNSLCIGELS